MKNPGISVIIPAYRCEKTISLCLDSLLKQINNEVEVIVVLDSKNDSLKTQINQYPIQILEYEKRHGPAYARNYGAKYAKNEILFFLDSDVILKEGCIKSLQEMFSNAEVNVVIGMYDIEPANPSPVTYFQTIKKISDYNPTKNTTFSTISSSLFAIRKIIFNELNGFNEEYTSNTVEDMEFGHRINEKYKINLSTGLIGMHFFPNYYKMLRNYYIRTKEWSYLFFRRKKFDTGAASKRNSISLLICFMIVVLTIKVFFQIINCDLIPMNWYYYLVLYLICIFSFVLLNYQFFNLAIKTKGLFFSFYAAILLYILFIPTFAGMISSLIKSVRC